MFLQLLMMLFSAFIFDSLKASIPSIKQSEILLLWIKTEFVSDEEIPLNLVLSISQPSTSA